MEDILVDNDMNIKERKESIYYILKPQRLSLDIAIFLKQLCFNLYVECDCSVPYKELFRPIPETRSRQPVPP